MIKNISIKNFQSHKSTKLTLSDGINVLVGESDNGKSAIYRAIKMLFFNQSGINFIHFNEKNCSVEAILNDCRVQIDKPENQITLDDETYSSIGRGVPDDVKNKTGIKEIDFVDGVKKIINFQDQHNYKFMIDDQIENARILGSISGINGILNAIKYANKEKKSLGVEKKLILANLDTKNNEIKKYDGIEKVKDKVLEINNEVLKIESEYAKVEKLGILRSNLSSNIDSAKTNLKNLEKYSKICKFNDDIDEINKQYTFYNKLLKLKNRISDLNNNSNLLNRQLNQFNFIIENKKEIEKISEQYTLYKNMSEKSKYLVKIINESKEKKDILDEFDKNILKYSKDHNKLVDSLEICDKCERPYTEEDKKRIKYEL